MILSSVDLPAPFGPMTPKQVVGPTVTETSSRMRWPPREWLMPLARRVADVEGGYGAGTSETSEVETEPGTGAQRMTTRISEAGFVGQGRRWLDLDRT